MRRRSWSALVAVLALSLTGCGSGDADADPDEPATSATGSPTSEPTADDGPTAEPATGPKIAVGSVQLRLPEGFETRRLSDQMVTSNGPDLVRITVSVRSTIEALPLEEQATRAERSGVWDEPPRRLDDVDVDGVPMFHLVGEGFAGYTDDRFGAQVDGYDVTILFASFGTPQERAEVYDSVLASVTWS